MSQQQDVPSLPPPHSPPSALRFLAAGYAVPEASTGDGAGSGGGCGRERRCWSEPGPRDGGNGRSCSPPLPAEAQNPPFASFRMRHQDPFLLLPFLSLLGTKATSSCCSTVRAAFPTGKGLLEPVGRKQQLQAARVRWPEL